MVLEAVGLPKEWKFQEVSGHRPALLVARLG